MSEALRVRGVLPYIISGLGLLMVLSWVVELTPIREILGGLPGGKNWSHAIIDSVAILLVGVPMVLLVSRVLRRLERLESMLTICAWCRKVKIDGSWVDFEEYLATAHSLRTSHGICGPCNEGVREEIRAKKDLPEA
jgi:hypothetical protein